MDVRPDYIMYIYHLFFFIPGYFCIHIRDELVDNNYSSVVLVLLVVACMAPEFMSHYIGKRSLTSNVKQALTFIMETYKDSDRILCFHGGFAFYLGRNYNLVPTLGGRLHPGAELKYKKYLGDSRRLWVVISEPRTGIHPELKRWLLKNTKLIWEQPERRYDYSFESFRIYLKE
jgi:hypothetical protein